MIQTWAWRTTTARRSKLQLARWPTMSHPIIFPGIMQHLGVHLDLLRDGLDIVQLLHHVVVDQLFVEVAVLTSGVTLGLSSL